MEELALMGRSRMAKSRITNILSTMWHSNRKKTNRTTKNKMGKPGNERCGANCTGRRVENLSDEQKEMA
jgi:hypothetical protein